MVRGHCQCVGPHTPSTPTKSMVKVSSGFSSLITYSLFSPQAHRRPMHALDGHKHAPSSATRTRPCRPQERALVGHKNIVPQHALIVSKTHPSALTVYSAICMFKVDLCLSKLDRYR